MPRLDPRVDAYIKKARPFAQPILTHLRRVVHEACPGIEAHATFVNFAPGRKREYVEWVLDARQAATRASRIKDAVAWMAEGRIRNWKYVK